MFVPATPVQPALTLAPVGVVSSAPATIATPSHTTFKVHSERLNVLENHRTTVTGKLLEGGHRARAGRAVSLQALVGRGWRTLALAHTGSRGRFRISYMPRPARQPGAAVALRRRRVRQLAPGGAWAGSTSTAWPAHPGTAAAAGWPAAGADLLDARRGQQDAPLRDARDAPLRGEHGARPCGRSWPLCGRSRIRPDRSHQACARLRRHRADLEHRLIQGRAGLGTFVQGLGFRPAGRSIT